MSFKTDYNTQSSVYFYSIHPGSIQKKELVAKSLVINQSVFEQRDYMTDRQKQDHQKFYDNIEYVYQNILKVLEGEDA
ncbi:transposase (12) BH0978 [Streptococcus pseudoporcinus]|uniref:Transposase (12) BH0978 n=1 Tax=Streptococcus pseudoporcinus TaxID=361101 RepID=A0A4V6L145_9STRE|nr:transposase (12) BH0978 [Streptococcus pseudoporcinus]